MCGGGFFWWAFLVVWGVFLGLFVLALGFGVFFAQSRSLYDFSPNYGSTCLGIRC